MPKAGFYAVKRGRQPGVYSTWEECEGQTKAFAGALYRKFPNLRDAEVYVGVIPIETSATKKTTSTSTSSSLLPSTAPSTSGSSTRKPSASHAPYEKTKPDKPPQYKVSDPTKFTIVYTDGACRGNGKPGSVAGIGVWYGDGDSRNIAERCPGGQTNNRAELIAVIRCLETDLDRTKPLLIRTDSQYTINCVNKWLPGFKRKNWKGVQNAAVIKHLSNLLDNRPAITMLEHVKGHAGERGNEGADHLAGLGASMPELADREWDAGALNEFGDAASGLMSFE